jgi:hypothetical protein
MSGMGRKLPLGRRTFLLSYTGRIVLQAGG